MDTKRLTPPSTILALPTELFLSISAYLDAQSILSLRKTCRYLADLTYGGSLWHDLFYRTRSTLLLPHHHAICNPNTATRSELEQIVFSALQTERMWLKPRESHDQLPMAFMYPTTLLGSNLLTLRFFLDRYILAVHPTGQIRLWEVISSPFLSGMSVALRACHNARGSLDMPWSMCEAGLNMDCSSLFVAVLHEGGRGVDIVSISFSYLSTSHTSGGENSRGPAIPKPFTLITTLILDGGSQILLSIQPDSYLVLLSRMSHIDVVNYQTTKSTSIPIGSTDLEELWNGIIEVRLCGRHILCFRTRSIEVHSLPTPTAELQHNASSSGQSRLGSLGSPILIHRFHNRTYRKVSISMPKSTTSPLVEGEPDTYTLSVLAYDLHNGLFHYTIALSLFPVPALDVTLLAAQTTGLSPTSQPSQCSPDDSPIILSTPLTTATSSSTFLPAFVTTHAFGSHGRRGVWVERVRGSTTRTVVAFVSPAATPAGFSGTDYIPGSSDNEPFRQRGEQGTNDENPNPVQGELCTNAPSLNAKAVFSVHSYDLREDITICALSEATGRIALGTRTGAIRVI